MHIESSKTLQQYTAKRQVRILRQSYKFWKGLTEVVVQKTFDYHGFISFILYTEPNCSKLCIITGELDAPEFYRFVAVKIMSSMGHVPDF